MPATGGVLPRERFERQVDTCRLRAFHQRRAALGIAEYQQLRGAQILADLLCPGGVVHAQEHVEPTRFGSGLEAVRGRLHAMRALDGHQPVRGLRSGGNRKQQR